PRGARDDEGAPRRTLRRGRNSGARRSAPRTGSPEPGCRPALWRSDARAAPRAGASRRAFLGGVEALVADHPAVPAWRAARAMVLAEIGRDVEARRDLGRLALADFADVPRDMLWLVC